MPWLFFATIMFAIAGLLAYICLGKEIWRGYCPSKPPNILQKWGVITLKNGYELNQPQQKSTSWWQNSIFSSPYQWPDVLLCLILGVYFLKLAASSSEINTLLTLKEIQAGTVFYVLLDLIILAFLILRHINPIEIFGLRTLPWYRITKLAMFWLITLYPIVFLTQLLIESLGRKHVTPQPLVQYLIENPRLSDHITVAFLAIIVAPFTEELIFRGYLYGVLRKYAGRFAAIIVTSCLFAGIHQHLSAFPGLFIFAIGLSLVYEATHCLSIAILMHAFFNLIGVLAAISGSF